MEAAAIAAVGARIAEIERRFAPPSSPGFAAALRAATAAAPPTDPAAAGARPEAATLAAQQVRSIPVATPRPGFAGAWASGLPPAGRAWAPSIERAALRAGVDPALLASLVWAESGFDPGVVSHAGAIGLGQLMPGTAAGLGVDPWNPEQNLDGAARYLAEQLDRFGSPELALAAYNAGPGRVAAAGGIPRIAETQAYVPRVMDHYRHLRGAA